MYPYGKYLPAHWKAWLRENRTFGSKLDAGPFPREVLTLEFPDASTARFAYAYCVHDEERGELAVFTEHCGYHVFPVVDLTWQGAEEPYSEGDA